MNQFCTENRAIEKSCIQNADNFMKNQRRCTSSLKHKLNGTTAKSSNIQAINRNEVKPKYAER